MARYIDADKLEKAIDDAQVDLQNRSRGSDKAWEINKPYFKGLAWARYLLNETPTADVVEVVRCGKCKHWIYWADSKTCSCEIHHIRTIRDDFCSYGERRDTE